jgi:glucose/arabinose dehydrogenase
MKARLPLLYGLMIVLILAAGCGQPGLLPDSGAGTPEAVQGSGAAGLPGTAAATSLPTATQAAPTSTVRPTPTPAAPAPTARSSASPAATTEPTLAPSPTRAPTSTPVPTTALAPTAVPAAPAIEQAKLALAPVARGLDRPLFVTQAGDGSGRLFIVEKAGTIRVLQGGSVLPRPFLDIRDRVLSRGSEQGLLGLAFAPDFARTGAFFVDYTDLSGDTVVSRFRVTGDPNIADAAGEFEVLGIPQPASNHNGGMLAFGPDGYLYVGAGDGGGQGDPFHNGRNPQALLGKILRLDVTSDPAKPYVIPPDNPWVAATWNGQAVRPEVWALGLRNPWRFSFDRRTGDLWIADVGQDRYEEIDRVPAGADGRVEGGLDFGWPIMEGTHCYPDTASCSREGLTLPVVDYAHGANGCSIIGGYVYRGKAMPALAGAYVYGDYCSGRIWALAPAAGGWRSRLLLESGLAISSFGEDQAGELYVTDLQAGIVYRLTAG